MMERQDAFDAMLAAYVQRSRYTPGQLSKLSGVPEETIINWLKGRVRRPREWNGLLDLARVLHLSEVEASLLLQAAHHPPLTALPDHAHTKAEQTAVARWNQALGRGGSLPHAHAGALATEAAPLVLPNDSVAAPQALPAGSRLPLSCNPLFVGRANDLLQIARLLNAAAQGNPTPTVAITGLGGLGKTQLAVEFAHRYGQYFAGGVFWLSFAQIETVPTEIAACGGSGALDLRADFGSLPLDEQVQLVQAAWQQPLPRLLIFDNCEDESLLTRWRPTTGDCYVVITSRRAQWDITLAVQEHPLAVLQRDESIHLLHQYLPHVAADDPHIDMIATELGDLPLALHLAGSFLAKYRYVVAPAAYAAHLQGSALLEHRSLQGGGISPTRHGQNVGRTFALSYDRLRADDPVDALACALLARTAYLAPGELIPRELLIATLHMPPEQERSLETEDALTRLIGLGLIDMGADGSLRMHRLVATFVREKTGASDAQTSVEQTLVKIANDLNDDGDVAAMHTLQRHLRFVSDVALARRDELSADLSRSMGHYLWLTGKHGQALQYLEHALNTHESRPIPNQLKIAEDLNLLGLVFTARNQFAQARPLSERALAIWEAHVGPDDQKTVDEVNNLGFMLFLQGVYDQAEVFMRRTLRFRSRTLGVHHAQTARSWHNLGVLRFKQGLYKSALRCFNIALSIRQEVLASEHFATAQTLNNLADALCMLGRYSEALQYHEQSLAMRRAVFDDQHFDIGESLANIAKVLHAQGQYAAAQSNYEQALEICMTMLGVEHLDTAYVLEGLGSLLRDVGDLPKAQSYLERALSVRKHLLGEKHPDYVSVLHNLGRLFHVQGDTDMARRHMEQALELRIEVLGERHPETAQSYHDLGVLLCEEGYDRDAQSYFERAFLVREKRLGQNHPLTAATRQKLTSYDI